MTTEKEFWEYAGRYFRALTSIQKIIDDLHNSQIPSKDVMAIKSMKRIEHIMEDFGKPAPAPINEDCVGCCKVVDVAANLQKELDETISNRDKWEKEAYRLIERLTECTNIIEHLEATNKQQSTTIEELEAEVNMLPDNFWSVVGRRDATIKQQKATIDELEDRNTSAQEDIKDLAATFEYAKLDRDIRFQNYQDKIENLRAINNNVLRNVDSVEAELSARKGDSEVLMKVVEIVKNWDDSTGRAFPTLIRTLDELVDYTDAPEGPPDPPADEGTTVRVIFTTPGTIPAVYMEYQIT